MKDMQGGSTIYADAGDEISDDDVDDIMASAAPRSNNEGERRYGGQQDKVKKQHKKSSDRHSGTTLPYTIQLKGDIKVSCYQREFTQPILQRLAEWCICPWLQVTAVRHAGVAAAAAAARVFDPSRSAVRRPCRMVARWL